MKIKIISARNIDDFEHSVNEFVKDKHVADIKYTSFPVVSQYGSDKVPKRVDLYDRALIMYEEMEDKTR